MNQQGESCTHSGIPYVVENQGAYVPLCADSLNPILAKLITDVGDRPVAMMWVSSAGPNNDQWLPNGVKRANNAVVFSELDTCDTPTR